jgi:hypothetical protein
MTATSFLTTRRPALLPTFSIWPPATKLSGRMNRSFARRMAGFSIGSRVKLPNNVCREPPHCSAT